MSTEEENSLIHMSKPMMTTLEKGKKYLDHIIR